jgi:acyl phosphate:glycerol-3-phosphate acyltransferase
MTFLYFILAYFLGSIPTGLIIGKAVKGIDLREHGSKNIGATNVFRIVGKKWGFLVLFLDALKGYIAVKLPVILSHQEPSMAIALGLGITAILGHGFSLWLKFKGGKGVATSLGTFLAIAPVPTLITFAAWCIVFAFTHIISISSLSAAVIFPIVCFIFVLNQPKLTLLLPISLLLGAFIFYTHRANIQRLLRKEEKRLF